MKFLNMKFLKDNFLTGLLVLFPLGVIAWILTAIFQMVWSFRYWLPLELQPQSAASDALLTIVIFGIFVAGVSAVGLFSKFYLGRKILGWLGFLIQRIPLIRSIYSALDQLTQAFSQGGDTGRQFSRVVYVEFPRAGVWTLAFVTGNNKNPALPNGCVNLFVPTTPNPTSGFFLIAPENELRETHMSVEEAFKNLISLGIARPEHD